MSLSYDSDLSERVIGSAIEVHRHLGPGLLESAYEECLCFELKQFGIEHRRQVPLPVIYKDVRLDCGYRMDIVVERALVLEISAARDRSRPRAWRSPILATTSTARKSRSSAPTIRTSPMSAARSLGSGTTMTASMRSSTCRPRALRLPCRMSPASARRCF